MIFAAAMVFTNKRVSCAARGHGVVNVFEVFSFRFFLVPFAE